MGLITQYNYKLNFGKESITRMTKHEKSKILTFFNWLSMKIKRLEDEKPFTEHKLLFRIKQRKDCLMEGMKQ